MDRAELVAPAFRTPTAAIPSAGLRYIPELDGLRAIACLLVLLFHAAPSGVFSGGFLGVDMFFVLSGYLITNLLVTERDKRGKIAVGRFYLHRALRLGPALFLFLAAYLLVAPIVWIGGSHLRDAGFAALYLSNYSYPLSGSPEYIRHSWSLAVEEQFYLLWPVLVPFLMRRHIGIFVLVAAWMVITFSRYTLADGNWVAYYYPLHTHSSGLIAGACLAMAQRAGLVNISGRLGAGALFAFGICTLTANITSSAVTITIAELFSVIIIGSFISGTKPAISRVLASRPMVGVGRLSYGLYLWHFPIALYFRENFGFLPSAAATLSLALAGALFSYVTVEAWGRKMKTRLDLNGDFGLGLQGVRAVSAEMR